MFDKIRQHPDLYNLERGVCEENEIGIKLSDLLTDENCLILKIDAYYRSSRMHNPPKSVDCLIIVKCDTELYYNFYLIELKNINSPRHIKTKEIEEKFATTIEQFLKDDFKEIFLSKDYVLNDLQLYVVTDAYHLKNFTQEQYEKKVSGIEKKRLLFQKVFKFKDKRNIIRLKLPNSQIDIC